jgi:hypothetical protein
VPLVRHAQLSEHSEVRERSRISQGRFHPPRQHCHVDASRFHRDAGVPAHVHSDRNTGRYSDRYTVAELVGRYSNIPELPLFGQSSPDTKCANGPEPIQTPLPRVHAIHRRLSFGRLQQLLADYQAGTSANQLARRYDLSRASIRVLLREADMPRRYQAITKAETDQAVELYAAGLTIAQVAAKLDRPWATVQTALTRRGVVRRSRHDYC